MADADASASNSLSTITITGAVGAVVLLLVLLCSIGKSTRNTEEKENDESTKVAKKLKNLPKAKSRIPQKVKRTQAITFNHPLLVGTLKGHCDSVLGLDFSHNGKYLASVSEDRTVLVWSVKEFINHAHKSHRANIDLDHGVHVKFSPDSRAFLINTYNTNMFRVYKIAKKEDGTLGSFTLAKEFPINSDSEVIALGIATSGQFIMACFADTIIKLWDVKGKLLKTIDTKQMNNYHGAVSPCGRFVASSGFTPDVKVWEVNFDAKTGAFKEVVRAFELTGHQASVHSFSFSNDSSRMVSVSKDNTWKFWDTSVLYKQGQDPQLLFTGNITTTVPCSIVLAPDARSVALAYGNTLHLLSTFDGKTEATFEHIFAGPISAVQIDNSSRYVVAAGDRQIYVFHNIAGYLSSVAHLEKEHKTATGEMVKRRLSKQLSDARASLEAISKTSSDSPKKK